MTETNDFPKLLKARQRHSRIFAVLMVALLLVSAPDMAAGEFPRECMLWLGYFLVIIGALGRGYCSAYIGGRKNDVVVREGPFAVVRNPLYVFSFLAMVGIGLQSGMLTILILLVGAFMLYYPAVVAKEENFLRHKFGEAYLKYTQEVPRWIPNLKLWNEPALVESQPKFLRKTLMDAAIFFIPMPAFAILESLHSHAILPVWLTLS
jgi:protein-S-isoprenylcysteine O-methyltransferase Ste14